ncbi:MAG: SH3 domain-containing protein [Clostridia bacterium]|nr:SH3 domain-containing protein [Clostridia bacterium]
MSDNIRFDDDYFADNEPKEREPKERMTKDASKKKSDLSPETLMKIIIAAVAVGAVIIIVLASLVFASFSDKDNKDDGETTTISSVEGENTVGTYTVTISESPSASLNLREQASMEASSLTKIPNGEHLLVSEVVAADGITWGKVSYKNFTGYVDMKYLVKSYTGTVPSVPDETTNAPEGTSESASAEEPEAEVTTKPAETTTAAPTSSSSNSGAEGATGKYIVDAQPSLNLRDGHSVDALSIAKIPDKEEITIVEVYYDEDAPDNYTKYWGKTTYGGITGWVAMGYLDSAN